MDWAEGAEPDSGVLILEFMSTSDDWMLDKAAKMGSSSRSMGLAAGAETCGLLWSTAELQEQCFLFSVIFLGIEELEGPAGVGSIWMFFKDRANSSS